MNQTRSQNRALTPLSDPGKSPADGFNRPAGQAEIVLLQTVGTGGPQNPVWEALAFTVRRIKPHVLVQLCSPLTFQETVPKFNDVIGDDMPPSIRRYVAGDEDNLEDLTLRYIKIIEDLRAEYPQARFEVDFTSGTKAMSAALVAAAIARRADRLHYAAGPRNHAGRATRTTHLVSLNSDRLVAIGDNPAAAPRRGGRIGGDE